MPVDTGPVASRRKNRFRRDDIELVQAPLAHAAVTRHGTRATVDGLDLHTPQALAAQLELIDHNVQRGDGGGLLVQQRLHLFCRRLGQGQPGQSGIHPPGPGPRRLAVFDVAIELLGIHIGTPCQALARPAHHHVGEFSAAKGQLARAHCKARRQVGQRSAPTGNGIPTRAGRRRAHRRRFTRQVGSCGLRQHVAPGVHIQAGHVDVGHHAFIGHWRGFIAGQAHRNAPAQHPWLGPGHVAHIDDRSNPRNIQLHLVQLPQRV